MKELEVLEYDAPQVEVIEVQVEKGFATSPVGEGSGTSSGFGG